jgi:hypothetical protein
MILLRLEYPAFKIFKIELLVVYDEKPKVFFYFQETLVKARTLSLYVQQYRILFKIS